MKKAIIILSLIVLAILLLGGVHYVRTHSGTSYDSNSGRYMSIDSYVTTNISSLSPIKESLGGKYYVTNIETSNGTGTVSYEDGHNAYVADFTYTVDTDGKPEVTSFKVR